MKDGTDNGGERVLIVEDDLQIRTILERYLSAKGFAVTSAGDGLEGIRLFSRERPRIVLLDMLLPKLLGSDVCDMIKRSVEGAQVPVVMMSAVMKPDSLHKDLRGKRRPDAFLVKPFQFSEMLRIVSSLVQGPLPKDEVEGTPETLEILDAAGTDIYPLSEAGVSLEASPALPEPAPWPSLEQEPPAPEPMPIPEPPAPMPATAGLEHSVAAEPVSELVELRPLPEPEPTHPPLAPPRIYSQPLSDEPGAEAHGDSNAAEFESFLDDLKFVLDGDPLALPQAPVAEPAPLEPAPAPLMAPPPEPIPSEPAEEQALGRLRPKTPGPGLTDATFPELLILLYRRIFSGVLTLERDGGHKEIYFLNGYPVHAKSSYRGETLGPTLVRIGRITEPGYEAAVRYMEERHCNVAEALVQLGLVPAAELPPILRELQRENLMHCFSWNNATYELERGAERVASVPVFEMNPVSLVAQGIVECATEAELDAELRPLASHFLRTSAEFARFYPQIAPLLPVVDLEPVLDGTHRVGGLIDLVGSEERSGVLKSLKVLLLLGMIELTEGPSTAPAAPPPPEPAAVWPEMEHAPVPVAHDPELEARVLRTYVKMKEQTLFELLGVSEEAGADEIERAHAELTHDFHPDRLQLFPSTEVRNKGKEIYQAIGYAYDVLRDPGRRAQYVASLSREPSPPPPTDPGEQEFQAGERLLQLGDFAGAQACFVRALRYNPREPEYLRELGWALYQTHRQGSNDEMVVRAVNLIRKALSSSPHDDRAYFCLGCIYLERGEREVARKLLSRALKYNPANGDAARLLQSMQK
jgi:CheY-like chemotaxis protein